MQNKVGLGSEVQTRNSHLWVVGRSVIVKAHLMPCESGIPIFWGLRR